MRGKLTKQRKSTGMYESAQRVSVSLTVLPRAAKTLQSLGLSVDPPPHIHPGKRVKGTAQVPVPRGKGTESDEGKLVSSPLVCSGTKGARFCSMVCQVIT